MTKGTPDQIPADGLTTAERRQRPVLIVNTGNGKGKTTAALGTALRAWQRGWSIGMWQFIKSPDWRSGELAAFQALDRLHRETGVGGPVSWKVTGDGVTWGRKGSELKAQARMAASAWAEVRQALESETHRLYVLDEFTYPLDYGWVSIDEVLSVLAGRPGTQHVIITGRRAPQALIELATTVTEMVKLKHPFDVGQRGQAGIEW